MLYDYELFYNSSGVSNSNWERYTVVSEEEHRRMTERQTSGWFQRETSGWYTESVERETSRMTSGPSN